MIDLPTGTLLGFVSTLPMVLFEIPFWKSWGINELVEWQLNGAIVSRLTGNRNPRVGWIIGSHLFHGAISGLVFSLLLPLSLGFPFGSVTVLVDALLYIVLLWLIFSVAPRGVYEVNVGFRSSGRAL